LYAKLVLATSVYNSGFNASAADVSLEDFSRGAADASLSIRIFELIVPQIGMTADCISAEP
jgi:hypothetical protein